MSEISKVLIYRDRLSENTVNAEIPDKLFSIEYMKEHIRALALKDNMYNSLRAIEVMEKYHDGAFRRGVNKVPYIVHPLIMADQAFALGIADDIIVPVCLLHDVLEDSDAKEEELQMNEEIIDAVKLLTFDKSICENKDEAKQSYYNRISENRVASIVKVLDRCNNISNMAKAFSKEKMLEYIKETEDYVMPLLEMIKEENPEYENVVFILKYHMLSVLVSLKQLM